MPCAISAGSAFAEPSSRKIGASSVSLFAASTAVCTTLKTTDSIARPGLTGRSSRYRITISGTSSTCISRSPATPRRHSEAAPWMLAAVAAGSPLTTSEPRTQASPNSPSTMIAR